MLEYRFTKRRWTEGRRTKETRRGKEKRRGKERRWIGKGKDEREEIKEGRNMEG